MHLLEVRGNQRLAELNVLLLGVGLRGAGVDDLLPPLALGLALWGMLAMCPLLTITPLCMHCGYPRASATRKRKQRRSKYSEEETYGEVHHTGLSSLLDVLALGDLGVGVELHSSLAYQLQHSSSIVQPSALLSKAEQSRGRKRAGGATHVEQVVVGRARLDLARLLVDLVELGGRHFECVL